MRRYSLVWITTIVTLTLLLHSCSSQKYIAGRGYLVSLKQEEQGFGLYSYILFSKPSTVHTRELYLSVIENYLNSIPRIEELQRYVGRDSLNLVSLPLLRKPLSSFGSLDDRQKAQWLLDNYDYARAKVYLSKFEASLTKGPYIVSHTKALSVVNSVTEGYIVQNLSQVNARVVSLWVDAFLQQSAKAEFWDGEHLNRFVYDLRNFIANAAEGLKEVSDSLSWWKAKLDEWIVQK